MTMRMVAYTIVLLLLLATSSPCQAEDSVDKMGAAATRLVPDLGLRRAGVKALHGQRRLKWQAPGEASVPPPAAEVATASALVEAFLGGHAARDRALPASIAADVADLPGASEAAFLAPSPISAAAVAEAPAPAAAAAGVGRPEPGLSSNSNSNLNTSEESAGAWSQGRVEAAAAAADESAGDVAAGSVCAGLQGDPSEWLRSGGARGYLCAMQKMTHSSDEDFSYSFHAPSDAAWSVSRQAAPTDLASVLRQRLAAAQPRQGVNSSASGAAVSHFLAIPADSAYRNPQQALNLIAATASDAVQQARLAMKASGSGLMEFVPDPAKPGLLIGSDLTAFFTATVNDPSVRGIRLRPGNYTVNAGANPDAHLLFPCNPRNRRRTPFIVDLGGSTLIFQDIKKAGFSIVECVDVEIAGPVTAHHALYALPFTQGTITDITNDPVNGYTWTVQIHDGFPAESFMGNKAVRESYLLRYDGATRKLVDDYYDAWPSAISKVSSSPPTYRFAFEFKLPDAKVGDLMAVRGMFAHGIMLRSCVNVTVSGITMHNVGMFFVIDWSGHGNRFVDNTLAPYPGKIGNGEQTALLSSNGDGIHSVGATYGPIIERNTLANMGDDAISVHGMFKIVVKVDAERRSFTVAAGNADSLGAGSKIGVYEGDQLLLLGLTNITAVRQVTNPLLPAMRSRVAHKMNFTKSNYYEVTVDAWPRAFQAMRFDSMVANAELQGSGFVIRDNTMINNRGRGMLIKASNGVIERNKIIGPAWWGMQVMPEASWMESDWAHNLRIADNHVHAGYGGIFVGLIRRSDLGSGQYLNHEGITITGNTVVDAAYAPILVTSAKGVVIGGNTIRNCMCRLPPPGQGFTWITPGALIFVENVQNVSFSPPNSFVNDSGCAHGDYARPIALGRNAVDVELDD